MNGHSTDTSHCDDNHKRLQFVAVQRSGRIGDWTENHLMSIRCPASVDKIAHCGLSYAQIFTVYTAFP